MNSIALEKQRQGKLLEMSSVYNKERHMLKQMILAQQNDIENMMNLQHQQNIHYHQQNID